MLQWLMLCSVMALYGSAGWTATAVLGHRSSLGAVLGAYTLGWSLLCVVAVALSLTGTLGGKGLALGGVMALCTAIAAWSWRGRPRAPSLRPALRSSRKALGVPAVAIVAVVMAAAIAYLVVLITTTPPNDWDGLTYHLTRAALWLQDGQISYVDAGNDSRLNGNPPVAEIGMTLGLALTDGDRGAVLPSLLALGAAGLAVVGLARRVGLPMTEAIFSGLVFLSLPIVLLHGQALLNDLLVASFLLAATYFLLGPSNRERAVGALALGLALGTKFSAVLALPVLIMVVAVGTPAGRRATAACWTAVGLALGSPWYLVNAWHTHHLDGGLGADQGQVATHSFASFVTSARALAADILDRSGGGGRNAVAYVLVGAAIGVIGGTLGARRRDASLVRGTLVAGLAVAAFPWLLALGGRAAYRMHTTVFELLGRPDIATAPPSNWEPIVMADTSRSGYGPLGLVAVAVALCAALWWGRRGRLPALARAYALAPIVMIAVLALTIVWDEWRSRLQMFAMGLAVALVGLTLRSRALTWMTVGLLVPTVLLVLATSSTKPTGLGVLGSERSVWSRDRVGQLTTLRDYDGTPALLRAVDRLIPPDSTVVAALPEDSFLAPLLGQAFDRRLVLVADGASLPPAARWLVTDARHARRLELDGWIELYADPEDGWRVLGSGGG